MAKLLYILQLHPPAQGCTLASGDKPKKMLAMQVQLLFVRESCILRGRATVSHLVNKSVKKLLHMAALTAITYNKDLKAYYERKVGEEKKNTMYVINAVRDKLILRIFASVNQNRKYYKNYVSSLA